jgi:DNA-binding CsgD family transcriptional regulator
VAEICASVDGLPLAIELAAARINLMPLPAIAAWLKSTNPLDLLVTPGPHLPSSQKNLRSALERSYRLLTPTEQRLFRHLSVFEGSCTLEAAEAICSDDTPAASTGMSRRVGGEVLESAQSLSDRGLLYYKEQQPGEARLSMLRLIRQFAHELLEACGEIETAKHKHACYFASQAAEVGRNAMGADAKATYDRAESDQPNFMSALDWALASEERLDIAVEIGTSLYFFWEARNFCKDGLGRLETLAAMPALQARTHIKARVLNGVGRLRLYHSTPALAAQVFEEALVIHRDAGDLIGASLALGGLAHVARKLGELEKARNLVQEALQLRRQSGNRWLVAQSITHLAVLAAEAGQPEYAAALTVRGIAIFQSLGATCWVSTLMESLGKLGEELASQIQSPTSLQEISDKLDELWEVHKPNKYLFEQVTQPVGANSADMLNQVAQASTQVGDETKSESIEARAEAADLSALTPREVEVLRLLARGLTNAQMAEELMVSRHTVDVHIRSIYGKIDVHSRSAATRIAIAEGLI